MFGQHPPRLLVRGHGVIVAELKPNQACGLAGLWRLEQDRGESYVGVQHRGDRDRMENRVHLSASVLVMSHLRQTFCPSWLAVDNISAKPAALLCCTPGPRSFSSPLLVCDKPSLCGRTVTLCLYLVWVFLYHLDFLPCPLPCLWVL